MGPGRMLRTKITHGLRELFTVSPIYPRTAIHKLHAMQKTAFLDWECMGYRRINDTLQAREWNGSQTANPIRNGWRAGEKIGQGDRLVGNANQVQMEISKTMVGGEIREVLAAQKARWLKGRNSWEPWPFRGIVSIFSDTWHWFKTENGAMVAQVNVLLEFGR